MYIENTSLSQKKKKECIPHTHKKKDFKQMYFYLHAGLQHCSKEVQTPVALSCSLAVSNSTSTIVQEYYSCILVLMELDTMIKWV